jgi:hypothetical protein
VNIAEYFETRERDNGEAFTVLADGTPAWLSKAVQEAHGDELPNDWRYATCRRIVDSLGEDPDVETWEHAGALVDVYTADLLAWLADNTGRTGWVDEVLEEDVWDKSLGIAGLLGAAQYACIEQMVDVLAEAIAENG